MESGKVMNIDQVSQELGVARNLVYKQARTGLMPGWIRCGDRWLISAQNFNRYINGESQLTAKQ